MIYTAKELNSKLVNLTLVGQEDGALQFIGTDNEWEKGEHWSDYDDQQEEELLSDSYNPADEYER